LPSSHDLDDTDEFRPLSSLPRRKPPNGTLPRRRVEQVAPTQGPKPPPRLLNLDLPGLAHRKSRRTRILAGVLTFALLGLSLGIWLSPPVRQWAKGPTRLESDLITERARAEDLREQIADMNERLRRARPPETDGVEAARADDLARQVEELEAKLGIPRPPVTDGVQKSRAEDLQARLKVAEEKLKAPRPPVTDGVNAARARDLAAQNERLANDLSRPRPPVDPLANVAASMTKAEIVASRRLFGIYTTQSPFNYGEVDLVSGVVQRKANVVGYFQSFKDPFNAFPIRNTWSRGQVPLLTWESQDQVGNITAEQPEFRLSTIYGGAHDEYIRSYARGIRDLKMPVIIRFDHEMNGNWYPWSEWSDVQGVSINGNQKGDYPKAWRHVHDIFQAEGANDYAIWLWSPNRVNRICGQRRPAAFYPGDAYVDWIGMSGYYRNYESKGGDCDDVGSTFGAVFGNTLPELRRIAGAKPIFLSEIGATERGGDKAAWIADLFRGLGDNTDLIGFAWFSLAVTAGGEKDPFTHDWRINSSGPSQDAMRDGLARSGYGLAPTG
jgi:hypothetical protein